MSIQVKKEVVKRLLKKGLVPEAEVACIEFGLSQDMIKELMGGKNAD